MVERRVGNAVQVTPGAKDPGLSKITRLKPAAPVSSRRIDLIPAL